MRMRTHKKRRYAGMKAEVCRPPWAELKAQLPKEPTK